MDHPRKMNYDNIEPIMTVSWCYKVLKWLKLMFIGIIWCFEEFGSKTPKDVDDVWKLNGVELVSCSDL